MLSSGKLPFYPQAQKLEPKPKQMSEGEAEEEASS